MAKEDNKIGKSKSREELIDEAIAKGNEMLKDLK